MYTSAIIIAHDINEIERLFEPEEKNFGRSSYTIKKDSKNKKLIFDIKADDATALKTASNTIIKILDVWEKTKNITKK